MSDSFTSDVGFSPSESQMSTPKPGVPHLRGNFIVAKVGIVCGSKRPLSSTQPQTLG